MEPGETKPPEAGTAAAWRQGDYTLDLTQFPVIVQDGEGNSVSRQKVVGAVVITQTCDIVNTGAGRDVVTLCPLIEADEKLHDVVRSGSPAFTTLEHPPAEHVVVDLNRMTSVTKEALDGWERKEGFSSEAARRRFAFALERKHGRFAFPNDFVVALGKWRKRVLSTHGKPASETGAIYRSITEMRVVARPDWDGERVEIALYAVVRDDIDRAGLDAVRGEVGAQVKALQLPEGFAWLDPEFPFEVGTLDDFPARMLHEGRVLDFEYLSQA